MNNLTAEERKKKVLLHYWDEMRIERARGHHQLARYLEHRIDNEPLYKLLIHLISSLKTYAPRKKELLVNYLKIYLKIQDMSKRDYLYSKIEDFFRDMELKFTSQFT